MKLRRLLLIACLPFTAVFGEMRTYTSKDGQKTFRGELIEYESSTKKAKMRMARGKVLTFSIDVLSKEDQKYVEEQGPIVQAKKALSIETKHYSKRTEKNKPAQGQWYFEKYDHNYIVTVENKRDEMLKDVTVEYTFFIERNRREYQNKIEKVSGSDTIDLVLSNGTETITTKSANLESWSDNPVMPTGGGGGWCFTEDPYGLWGTFNQPPIMVKGGKSKYRDKLLGLVVHLKVNGEIIKTGASNDKVLAMSEDTD